MILDQIMKIPISFNTIFNSECCYKWGCNIWGCKVLELKSLGVVKSWGCKVLELKWMGL